MLVLTRCPGRGNQATICIGPDMEITVLGIDGDEIRFAVTTPPTRGVSPDTAPTDFVPRPRLPKESARGLTPPPAAGILPAP